MGLSRLLEHWNEVAFLLAHGNYNFFSIVSCQKKLRLVSTQCERCFNVNFNVESTWTTWRWFNIDITLTLSRPRPISYRNQSIDLQSKSMDWFLYGIGLGRERVNRRNIISKYLYTESMLSFCCDPKFLFRPREETKNIKLHIRKKCFTC